MKEDNSQRDRPCGQAKACDNCLLDDCTNVVYGAIIGHLQMLEIGGRYSGNSHHLAQLLTQKVCDALAERAKAIKRR